MRYLGRITDDKDLVTKEYVDNAVEGAGSGDVTGPSSSTDGNIAVFDGATGKVIADSGANIDEFVLAVSPGTQSTATPLNADTLQGYSASHFAIATDLDTLESTVSTLSSTVSGKVNRSGDTMTGVLTAQNNTSYTTKQVRNITLSTSAPSGGSNGDIWIVYTE